MIFYAPWIDDSSEASNLIRLHSTNIRGVLGATPKTVIELDRANMANGYMPHCSGISEYPDMCKSKPTQPYNWYIGKFQATRA